MVHVKLVFMAPIVIPNGGSDKNSAGMNINAGSLGIFSPVYKRRDCGANR